MLLNHKKIIQTKVIKLREIIQNDEETTSKQKITEVPKSQDGKTSQEDKLKENENSIKDNLEFKYW